MDNFGKRQQQKYETALQRCVTVACEEYEHAQKELAEAETLIRELRCGMSEAQFEFKEYLDQVSSLRVQLLDALKRQTTRD